MIMRFGITIRTMDTIRNEIEIIDTKPIAVINSSCMNT
jgi:hypothetical protein